MGNGRWILRKTPGPRDPGSPKTENGFMEPKYLVEVMTIHPNHYLRFGDWIPGAKNPGMSEERDYPYIPILRMGLEP